MAVSWVTYKDRKILYIDYREDKTPDELIGTMREGIKESQKTNEMFLLLSDLRGTINSKEFTQALTSEAVPTMKAKVIKNAVLGIVGLKKAILSFLKIFSKIDFVPFDTEEQAKEWLVE